MDDQHTAFAKHAEDNPAMKQSLSIKGSSASNSETEDTNFQATASKPGGMPVPVGTTAGPAVMSNAMQKAQLAVHNVITQVAPDRDEIEEAPVTEIMGTNDPPMPGTDYPATWGGVVVR